MIIPYLRGYGSTRFLSNEILRNGQPSALAVDITAFMDALKVEQATLAAFDWGARTANIIAALWPGRSRGLGVREQLSDRQPASRQNAVAAKSRTRMVVPILFCYRPRPSRLRQIPTRL